VRIINTVARSQNSVCDAGRKVVACFLEVWSSGTKNRTRMEASRATTPPSFLGIDRRIAYANKKYHSGCMCTGVTKEFAGLKFSGSESSEGDNRTIDLSNINSIIKPVMSFVEK